MKSKTVPKDSTVETMLAIGKMKNPAGWLQRIHHRMVLSERQPCFVRIGVDGDGSRPSFKIVYDENGIEISQINKAYDYYGNASFRYDKSVNGSGWSLVRSDISEVEILLEKISSKI
ncbi:hypothetical protein NVS89_20230 [Ancylobacter sp. MQZ15Z-1]|uniref:Uncharacterized protein n=1 Tax=Ancylobacter mangrovi TaxID=2972472 RepID=A0A9X2T3R3_9HYPH|nr:hypothetical protein [Ancylobacter mangrovi]MCS0497422.1 hypothetical protein [Ancylobacter mangrovi]